jgi:ligand-binding sensor domain-containing protein
MRAILPTLALICLSAGVTEARAWRVSRRLVNTRDVRAVVSLGDTIWQATTGGLLAWRRGDPRPRLVPSVPGRLHALLRDGDALWVGGDGGLVRIRGTRIERRIAIEDVRALARFEGRLFAGTWGGGLQEIVGHAARSHRLGPRPSMQRVTSLAATPAALYVGTAGGGVFRFDGRRARRLSRRRLPSAFVWALAPAQSGGGVWVGTLGGLALVRGRAVKPVSARLEVRDVRALVEAAPGQLMVGTYGGGLWRVSKGHARRVRKGRIWSLAADDAGALLVGTSEGALHGGRLEPVPRRGGGPASNDVSALVHGAAGLWIGTFDAGLSLLEPGGRWRHFGRAAGPIDDRINHLALQRAGGREVLWVATPRGASRFDGARWSSYPAGEDLARGHVNGIAVRGGRVYLASGGGVSIFEGKGWRRVGRRQGLALRQVTAVHVDARGTLWVGGLDGLARRRPDGRWSLLSAATGHLPDDWITALAAGGGGRLWAGTYDGGLALVSGAEKAHLLRERDGLPCGWVNPHAMTLAEGALWIGTMEGGLVLRDRAGRWRRLGLRAGLPALDVTAVVPARTPGAMWVGTRGGVVQLRRTEKR